MVRRQKIYLAIIVVVNAIAWAMTDNIVNLVAKDEQTILGRYARGHFALNLTILVISLIGLYIDQARTRQTYKRRWFQVIAVLLGLTPLVLLGDLLLRLGQSRTYVFDAGAYRRPANARWTQENIDLPEAVFTYPNAAEGYPRIPCTFSIDARGFRNATALDRADVVVLGDSFVEGSHVSDEHPWPVRLARLSGLSVYSLGVSGYSPARELATLRRFGTALKPSFVIFMLYEGNDFHSTTSADEDSGFTWGQLAGIYFKQSPIVKGLDQAILGAFGRIGSLERVKGSDVLSWLPLRVPDSAEGKRYTFAPKQISEAFKTEEIFEDNRGWVAVSSVLQEMKETCDRNGIRLVIAYAPSKAYVVLPLAIDRLPAEKVWGFVRLGAKQMPVDAKTFMSNLAELLGTRERVTRGWCEKRSIPFISFVEPLRQATAEGQQVYFTYDQHWTPPGHEIVARTVADFLAKAEKASG
ncbi:MAG TPA: hypothetical protein VMV94_20690 [Phycisphaerae bacterium]|nr:hypothetical protein [Phycisphaerae bacterium]